LQNKKNKLRVITVLGTRPEIVRLSRVMTLLDRYVNHVIVHTGQNYDYELNQVFFKDLNIRKPDYFLKVDCSSLGKTYGNILISIEVIFKKEKPDAVLILGDTNTAISAIMAKRMKIPVYHMEAGNRCFDWNVPEEINRRMIDHISDFNMVYTEHARRNLLFEGLHPRSIYLTGSPMREVLDTYLDRVRESKLLKNMKLEKNRYFLVSVHREENVDIKKHFLAIIEILGVLYKRYKIPIIVSTHPRTQQRLNVLSSIKINKNIRFLKPFGFIDYISLQQGAFCVISDSGTISEESSILSFPAITIRNAMERPEALDTGNIIITGLRVNTVLTAVEMVTKEWEKTKYHSIPAEYEIKNTSFRVVKLIIGTAKLSYRWQNIDFENR
jgi:UDP-N-acetylglucosamine 2-epimerase (non-hydrolysing)